MRLLFQRASQSQSPIHSSLSLRSSYSLSRSLRVTYFLTWSPRPRRFGNHRIRSTTTISSVHENRNSTCPTKKSQPRRPHRVGIRDTTGRNGRQPRQSQQGPQSPRNIMKIWDARKACRGIDGRELPRTPTKSPATPLCPRCQHYLERIPFPTSKLLLPMARVSPLDG